MYFFFPSGIGVASALAELELELGAGLLLELDDDDELLGLGDELLELDDELLEGAVVANSFFAMFCASVALPSCNSHATAKTQRAPASGMSDVTNGMAGLVMGPMRVPSASS